MRLALLAILLALAAPAAAEPPAGRGATLVALAEALGQSHALRQACAGVADQFWRARMMRLMEVEQADEALEGQLMAAFNDGYASRRALFRTCTPAARRAEAAAAARGRSLSAQLSRAYGSAPAKSRQAAPDEMAPSPKAK